MTSNEHNETWERIAPRDVAAGTIRTTTPRVGRNELCPCGSGKKFKRCCCGPRPVADDVTRSERTSTTGASS